MIGVYSRMGGCSCQDFRTRSVSNSPQASRRSRHENFAGLDVSLEETSICIVDETGRIVKELHVAGEPEALVAALRATDLAMQSASAWKPNSLTDGCMRG